ncbi:B12-binding domain-containing radical SAM protein [Geoalkalibacter halelectricus]|uniref:B12-binding domain-containing radical SAM protein n=1 Tax=Geoalkalibacter halelectricus TaxID=2847045 RepID=UPI003D241502
MRGSMRIAMACVPIVEWYQERLVPAYMDGYRNNPHLGPYLLAAVLEQAGFDLSLVDLTCAEFLDESVAERFAEFDVVLLSCNSTNWPTGRLLIDWLKQSCPAQVLVVGGIHATLFGREVMQTTPVDYVIAGEGERSLPLLLDALQQQGGYHKVPGLIWRQDGALVANPPAPLLSSRELDALPLPLYTAMPPGRFKTIAIESSRGCQGNCLFCAIPFRKHWRPLSAGAFVDKVEALQPFLDKVEMRHFSVVDDCFTIDRQRALDIVELARRRGVNFQATYDARIRDFLDEELVEHLSSCSRGVLVGAESFLPRTLKRIGKPVTPDEIVRCARILDRYGLAEDTIFSFIIGFPWETKREVQENFSRIVDLALTFGVRIFLQWHTLTPGSALWHRLLRQGKVAVADLDTVGFLLGEKWFYVSSSLSVEDRLDISDMVTSVQKVMAFTKPYGSKRGEISFIIPPYLLNNKQLTEKWRESYFAPEQPQA